MQDYKHACAWVLIHAFLRTAEIQSKYRKSKRSRSVGCAACTHVYACHGHCTMCWMFQFIEERMFVPCRQTEVSWDILRRKLNKSLAAVITHGNASKAAFLAKEVDVSTKSKAVTKATLSVNVRKVCTVFALSPV